jgi:hypothetical protein
MKPSRVLPFTLLLAATTVFSQNVVLHHGFPKSHAQIESNCPVDMAIDRSGLYERREVHSAPYPEANLQIEQRIRLDLTNRNPTKIVAAQITVHGLSQKTRYMELTTPEADMAKSFHLSLDLRGNGQSSNVLWLTRFAVITRVDLNAVTYADGSAWHEPGPAACSVAPSLLVRVGLLER